MPGLYTEADYENSVIELFRNMGYSYLYGPDIERDFHNPLYEEELVASLYRLNRSLPEDAISDALFKLKNFENGELVQKNAVFMDYLQNGIPVRYFEKGEERSSIVYLVDYKNIRIQLESVLLEDETAELGRLPEFRRTLCEVAKIPLI